MLRFITTIILCHIIPFQMYASSDLFAKQDAMVQDLESVKYIMDIKYAPKEWKKDHLNWNLETALEKAKVQIYEGASTSKDYQKILRNFLKSTHDYHVNTHFISTEWSVFPISVKCVDNHYYISSLDFEITLSLDQLLFIDDMDEIDPDQYEDPMIQVGDEILAIDGVPVKEIIEKMIDEKFAGDRSKTGYALAEKSLFLRRGQYGDDVPSGDMEITVRHMHDKKPSTYRLPWFHFQEWVMNKSLPSKTNLLESYVKRDFKVHYAEDLLKSKAKVLKQNGARVNAFDEDDEEDEIDWREKGFLPELGKVLWETDQDDDFYAYLYKNKKGQKIGYLYLSDFYPYNPDLAINNLINILKWFNKESDALVLDITNNPGGNIFYMYAVLSVLTDQPLGVPTNREIITQEDVYKGAFLYKATQEMEEDLDDLEDETLSGYPITADVVKAIGEYGLSLVRSWENDITFTEPTYLFGIKEIMPNPRLQYTKPLLVLINELDFSCADFFPAVLQDNQRATLLGTRTAGAGGYVLGYKHTSRFGVEGYSLTGSIAYRKNGKPLENLGVTPDIQCECTKRDMEKNYIDYVRTVNREVMKLIK